MASFRYIFGLMLLLLCGGAWAHEGHDHGDLPGRAATAGPLLLSDATIANLGIETVEANLVEMAPTLEMMAQLTPLPERVAQVTPAFEGSVVKILAKLGETVAEGQPLIVVQPRMVGNPPVTLKAAISGVVTAVNVTLGQAFSPDTTLMTVADYSRMLAKGVTYESPEMLKVKMGAPARLELDVAPGVQYEGVIQRADAGLGSEARTFEVYAELENRDGRLLPNLMGKLSVAIGKPELLLAVPQKAVLGEMGERFAFVREGAQFERRVVRLGVRSGGMQEIVEGVMPGEQVVTQGAYQLQYATSSATVQEAEPADAAAEKAHGVPPPWWALGGLGVGVLLGWIFGPRGRHV